MVENSIEPIIIPEEFHLERIDRFLRDAMEMDLSRSLIQKLIKNGHILVNQNKTKQNYKLKTDDIINITIPEPEELDIEPQKIPITIIYEDNDIAVINKQAGIVVHPGPGNWDNTLVNALLYHLKNLSSIGGVIRPGIVHRLDKDTAGIMIIAKNDTAHKSLVNIFSERKIEKKYKAIVTGKPHDATLTINEPIARHPKYRHKMTILEGGKEAITDYKIEKIWNSRSGIFSLLDISIHTGRTHQIRVHLSSIGNPIVGDPIYSKKWKKYNIPYLLLTAKSIAFEHPRTKEELHFSIDLPDHINEFISKLEKSLVAT